MNEHESVVSVVHYLQGLGFPLETIKREYLVGKNQIADIVVEISSRILLVAEIKNSSIDLENVLKEGPVYHNKTVDQVQQYAKYLEAPYYILSNGEQHKWFSTDEIGDARLISEMDFENMLYELGLSQILDERERSQKELINSLNCKFFLVGSYWDGDEQSDRFFKEGVWQNGYEDRFIQDVKSVSIGDILIVKSTFSSNSKSYLRIKGIGRIIENTNNGTELKVDWRIKNISVDIEGLGSYRSTFAEVYNEDVFIIFKSIGFDNIFVSGLATPNSSQNNVATQSNITTYKIAGLLSDSEKGIDYLDITKDVRAFARVIAAKSFDPPLAIALFGKWGSGKSFFMQKLMEQIKSLPSKSDNNIYCTGIAHIHFNAWSYLDSNLWASLVTKIFEGLHQYISKDSKAASYKKEIEKTLVTELNVAQKELADLKYQKNSLNEQIEKLTADKSRAENKLNKKIQEIKFNTLKKVLLKVDEKFKISSKVEESLNSNNSFVRTTDELKKIIPEKYWESPNELYKKAKSKTTFIKGFFRGKSWITNILWLTAILVIIYFTPSISACLNYFVSRFDFSLSKLTWSSLTIIGIGIIRAIDTYKRLQPLVASFWKIKVDHETEMLIATSEFEQYEKALKLQIEKNKNDIISINENLSQVTGLKATIQFKIENALSTQALYSFIEKRSSSEDYQKHLGIVSIIRKDFEILSELFSGHNSELINAADKKKFIEYFDRPLERIVLYIDDLDRCPEDNVVQVLEAVNLLMAFPLFVVIVGVDSRWVKKALLKKHVWQFTGAEKSGDLGKVDLESIEPANYLEKIFQVPFHLKSAKDKSVKDMIRQLAQTRPDVQIKPVVVSSKNSNVNEYPDESTATSDLIKGTNQEDNTKEPVEAVIDTPEALSLTDYEVSLMQDMSEILGDNPRAIKRFVNIYRIIKAHEDFNFSLDSDSDELPIALFLIAFPLGKFKKLLPSFIVFMANYKNTWEKLSSYLKPSYKIDEGVLDELKNQLHSILTDKVAFKRIEDSIMSPIVRHNSFIKRFTFSDQ